MEHGTYWLLYEFVKKSSCKQGINRQINMNVNIYVNMWVSYKRNVDLRNPFKVVKSKIKEKDIRSNKDEEMKAMQIKD